jgi:hypothetical protein
LCLTWEPARVRFDTLDESSLMLPCSSQADINLIYSSETFRSPNGDRKMVFTTFKSAIVALAQRSVPSYR